ncbi:MAG: formylglycine-generating enzyme family protein, partial [Myxococcota bacterium]
MRSTHSKSYTETMLLTLLYCSITLFVHSPASAKSEKPRKAEASRSQCGSFSPEMACIPKGVYIQGSNRHQQHSKAKFRAESPRHRVWLFTFYVDRKEVTNTEYIACMNAGHCRPPSYWARKGGSMWKRFRTAQRPFVRATWYLARDYCAYRGKRLLTEAEWEAAARGPKGFTYPWGNQAPQCKWANYRVFPPHTSYPSYAKMRFCPPPFTNTSLLLKHGQDQTWPVGRAPAFRGIHDMAGNGYEWVQDFYDPHAYACAKPPCQRRDPKGPCAGQANRKNHCVQKESSRWTWRRIRNAQGKRIWKRVQIRFRRPRRAIYRKHILKGGSWWWYADHMRAAFRRPEKPYTGN